MTREELLAGLKAAAERVAQWPECKRIMFERSRQAERWLEEQSR